MSSNTNGSEPAVADLIAGSREVKVAKPAAGTPQWEAISVCLAMSERALVEVRENKQCLAALEKQNVALEKQNRELRQELKHAVAELKLARAEHDHKIFSLENDVASKVSYRGLWRAEVAYRPSDVVTRGGRLWFCNIETADKPGSSSAWRMMDKEDEGRR